MNLLIRISKLYRFILLCSADCSHSFLIGDGMCNDETNNADCNYDGGDCCLSDIKTNKCLECACSIKGIIKLPNIPTIKDISWLIQTLFGTFIKINIFFIMDERYDCR